MKMETYLNHSLNKDEFFEILNEQEAQEERINKISNAGLDIWDSDVIEYGNFMFDRVLNAYFNDDGVDWISWWIYEKAGNPEMKVWDKDNNEISLETKEELWEFIKQYRK